jgi:hypothetical protein
MVFSVWYIKAVHLSRMCNVGIPDLSLYLVYVGKRVLAIRKSGLAHSGVPVMTGDILS